MQKENMEAKHWNPNPNPNLTIYHIHNLLFLEIPSDVFQHIQKYWIIA